MQHKPEDIEQKDWDAVESSVLTDDLLVRMQPVHVAHPDMPSRMRGPQKALTKVPISIRLSPEVVTYFRAQGRGWQKQIDDILSEHVRTHSAT